MKVLLRTSLALYLIVLLWLVLFKFSFDLLSVLFDYQTRSLNLIPFAGYSQINISEMISNAIVFIPFGLLLGANLRRTELWEKLTYVFLFSLTVEMAQFLLAIGMTDITDVTMNTVGGLTGLIIYDFAKRYINNEKLDRFIVIAGVILLVVFIILRTVVFRVRY